MTQQQVIEEIKRLSVVERIALLEVISRGLREEFESNGDKTSKPESDVQDRREEKLAAVRGLAGILKMDSPPMTKEEVRDACADYLMEKYS